MTDNGNKRAYPIADPQGNFAPEGGLSKRELFAMTAMGAIRSNSALYLERMNVTDERDHFLPSKMVAELALKDADELLKLLGDGHP